MWFIFDKISSLRWKKNNYIENKDWKIIWDFDPNEKQIEKPKKINRCSPQYPTCKKKILIWMYRTPWKLWSGADWQKSPYFIWYNALRYISSLRKSWFVENVKYVNWLMTFRITEEWKQEAKKLIQELWLQK